jgi:Domain of unknown function (DUF927)
MTRSKPKKGTKKAKRTRTRKGTTTPYTITMVPDVGWQIVQGALTVTATDSRLHAGQVKVTLEAAVAGTIIDRAPIILTLPTARKKFLKAIATKQPDLSPLSETALIELETAIRKAAPAPGNPETSGGRIERPQYEARDGELIKVSIEHGFRRRQAIANFTAEIVAELIHDDGVETETVYELEVEGLSEGPRQITVPYRQFWTTAWLERLGHNAIIYPQRRDDVTTAIKSLSPATVPRRTVYTHLGWREVAPGRWAYLHAGGAIGLRGLDGLLPTIYTHLHGALEKFVFPTPPIGPERQKAIETSLRLIEIGPSKIVLPLYMAIARAVLGEPNFSLHLTGDTGHGKTEIATLIQQHFGKDLYGKALPASWTSTANALEELQFLAKDAIFVIDDLKTVGSQSDQLRTDRTTDRVFRAQGNRSGRSRMDRSGNVRMPRPPRGLTISTGEETPRGNSLRARVLIIPVGPTDFDIKGGVLDAYQDDALAGYYAEALAAFLDWLAPRYGMIPAWTQDTMKVLRKHAKQAAVIHGHRAFSLTCKSGGWPGSSSSP